MVDEHSDDVARNRWMIIQALRLGGVALVVTGVLIQGGRIGEPHWLGYVLIGVGLIDVFLVPTLLAKRWRTPKP